MKQYWSFFRIRFITGLQYRVAAYAGVATQFAWGFLSILMFSAFYRANPADFPMEFTALSSYIWLQQAFLALFSTWSFDSDIFSSIVGGGIAYEMVRPTELYLMWFVKSMANRLSRAILRCFPVVAVALFLPKPYGLSLPGSFSQFLFFLLTMLLGFLTVVSFTMIVYGLTFFTMYPSGVRLMLVSVTEFLSGALVPLPFLPEAVCRGIELTPFGAMQNVPLRVYSGDIVGKELLSSVLLQFFWLFALTLIGFLLMQKAKGKVVVQGG